MYVCMYIQLAMQLCTIAIHNNYCNLQLMSSEYNYIATYYRS